ncbi:MAG TPA: hypothetical protein PLC89_02450 [Haliscomenobacter sp.]|uniref:MbnP family protein n=1 Tax=Haliscomenobacter sp. TaxID=2717303 RepID=UPI002C51AF56|nr:MbnP family protein [Haliscomenobacter sp.]HOY16118.1 hypothetical protein [Haliscomenobacter sp.]
MSVKSGILLFILSCFAYPATAQLSILPVFGGRPIVENTWYVSTKGDSVQFDNIRFYLSDIQFEMDDKTWIKDTVSAHLIDVFDPATLHIITQKIDLKLLKTIHFNLGIDSLTNVSGALGGDLDPQKGMYWAWQSGYINLKIEGRSPQCKSRKNVFQYHIGGYLQPFSSMRKIELPVKNTIANRNQEAIRKGLVLTFDFSVFFGKLSIATQKNTMMPGKEAMQLADYSTSMFSIYALEN